MSQIEWQSSDASRAYDKINAERAGQSAPPTEPAPPGTALGVLSAVLENDGQQISAPPASWPRPSPNETWPDRATSPPSSTPGSATKSRRRRPRLLARIITGIR